MANRITLIAMSPAGSTLVVRDPASRLWLCPPEGAGLPRQLNADSAEQAIARLDLERVGREFGSWEELDAFRQKRAAETTPQDALEVESLDLHDVELMIEVAERWLGEGEGERAGRLVIRLLRVPATRSDEATHARLLDMLERLERPHLPHATGQPTSLQVRAREHYELARAA